MKHVIEISGDIRSFKLRNGKLLIEGMDLYVNAKHERSPAMVKFPVRGSKFTVQDIRKMNPTFHPLTIRVRLTQLLTKGKLIEVGTETLRRSGRPRKIYIVK